MLAVGIDDGDHVGQVLHERAEAGVAPAHRLLRLHALGDVAGRDDDALDLGVVEPVVAERLDHAHRAVRARGPAARSDPGSPAR